MAYVVELIVFTGRANPRFVLTGEAADAVGRWMSGARIPAPSGVGRRLGYQGMLVYFGSGTHPWHPWFSLVNGVATFLSGPETGRSFGAVDLQKELEHAARDA